MLYTKTGLIKDNFYVTGLAQCPVYLLDGDLPVLFDGGTTSAGRIYEESIQAILGTRQPKMLFLTHVHWDHCGAASYLRDKFPSLVIAASHNAAQIIKRQSAIELIDRLNKEYIPSVAAAPEVDISRLSSEPFRPFKIEMELVDGQIIDLGAKITAEVLATPGHTRDHLSYYIPEKKILVASEASGCLDGIDNLITEFVADYDAYLASLKRMAKLPVEILCQGHRIVFVGSSDVRSFFDRSIKEAIRFKNRVCELLEEENHSIERAVLRVKAEQYDNNKGIKQPEKAYLINLRAQVAHLAGKI